MKVWITFAFEDKEFVERLRKHLREADIEVLDVENEILPGDNIVESIYQAISSADIIFVIISKASEERQWFSTELGLIISEIRKNRHKKIIPILKDRQAQIPPFINQYQYLDISESKDAGLQIDKLIATIKTREKRVVEFKDSDTISTELLLTKEDLLKQEKYEYEKQRRQKQRLLSLTFLTTILATTLTLVSFLFASKDFFSLKIDSDIIRTIIPIMLGLLIGVLVSTVLEQLKKK